MTASSSGLGAWPPPSLLYFSAYDRKALGISVDDRYVYWYQEERTFMRGLTSGVGEPKELMRCGACDLYQFVADSDTRAVYFLAGQNVLRVDRESGEQTTLSLDWDHNMGGIAVDAQFVYTVMPGCAAITRIDKRTLAKEAMRIPGVAFPNRAGVTQLAVSGTGLLCASPSDIFAIDHWQAEPRHLVQDIGSVWGIVAHDQHGYWLEANRSPNTIGQVSLTGGTPIRVSEVNQSPQTMKLINLEPNGQLVYGTGDGLQTFDRNTNQFGPLAKIGYVLDLATDSAFVYATIWGKRSHLVNGSAQVDQAYYIAKISVQDLK